MITFSKSFQINRPQQDVFDFLADPTNDTQWRATAISSEWVTEGPVGVGSKLRSVDKFLGRRIEATSEVTVWDPPSRGGQKTLSGPVPFEFTITLEPKGSGTRLTINGQAELGRFFKIAEGLLGKLFEKQMENDFNRLKRVLEEGQE